MRRLACALLLLAAEGAARAQAEPAPESYIPPGHTRPIGEPPPPPPGKRWASEPKWHLGVAPRLDFLLGDATPGLGLLGFGGGVTIERALLPLGRLRFGVGVAFGYDRFLHERDTGTQSIGEATFIVRAVLDGIFGRMRPWAAFGGGMSVAHYNQPVGTGPLNAAAVTDDSVLPLVHGAIGLSGEVYHGFDIGMHGECNATFLSPSTGNPARDLYGAGWCTLALDLGFRL